MSLQSYAYTSHAAKTIHFILPKIEDSLYSIMLGPAYYERVFQRYHRLQVQSPYSQGEVRPEVLSNLQLIKDSKECLYHELRLGCICQASTEEFVEQGPNPYLYFFHPQLNGSGRKHGFLKVLPNASWRNTQLECTGSIEIHYKVIMGEIILESPRDKAFTNGLTDGDILPLQIEFRLPPLTKFRFINKGVSNALLYFTEFHYQYN